MVREINLETIRETMPETMPEINKGRERDLGICRFSYSAGPPEPGGACLWPAPPGKLSTLASKLFANDWQACEGSRQSGRAPLWSQSA